MTGGSRDVNLVTGMPTAVARLVVEGLARRGEPVVVLAGEEDLRACEGLLAGLGTMVRVLGGDPAALDLGLRGDEARRLSGSLGRIFHFPLPASGDEGQRPLRAAREIVAMATSCSPPAGIVAMSPLDALPGRAPLPPPAGSKMVLVGGRRRPVLETVLAGRAGDLGALVLRTGLPVAAGGPWMAGERGHILHLLVVLHLSLDIRVLRRVAQRRLLVTDAAFAARVALGDARPRARRTLTLDLRDPSPPTLAQMDRALGTMLPDLPRLDDEFLSSLRRHGKNLLRSWTGQRDPALVLHSWTSSARGRGGAGEWVAREMGLEWRPTLEVVRECLPSVLDDVASDLRREVEREERDALMR